MARGASFLDIHRVGAGFIVDRNAQVKQARGLRIDTQDLRALRQSLRRMDKEVDRQLNKELKAVAKVVRADARRLAPQRSGKLARKLRYGGTLHGIWIGSDLPYGNVIHWGGTTGPGHKPGVPWSGHIKIRPSLFMSEAIERREDWIVDEVADAVDKAAMAMGWR